MAVYVVSLCEIEIPDINYVFHPNLDVEKLFLTIRLNFSNNATMNAYSRNI